MVWVWTDFSYLQQETPLSFTVADIFIYHRR